MDSHFAQMIEVNIKGRVFAICHAHSILDPTIIGYYNDILQQAVQAKLDAAASPADFCRVLDEQAAWLEAEIDQKPVELVGEESVEEVEGQVPAGEACLQEEPGRKQPSGYVPKAKSMPERLADQRVGIQDLLEKECVTLKLITPEQAKQMRLRLLGQEPEKAEEELVAELRNILHQQVRAFIRKHDGGPWATVKLQHELRMDIVATHSLRSLVTLAKELLAEREEWLQKNRVSLSARLFGGKIRFKKS